MLCGMINAQGNDKDTLLFHYDASSKTLVMKNTGPSRDLGFELSDDFANWLKSQLIYIDNKNCINPENSNVLLIYCRNEWYEFADVTDFDSLACSKMVVHRYIDAVNPEKERIPIKVTVSAAKPSESNTDAAAAGDSDSHSIPIIIIVVVAVVVIALVVCVVVLMAKKKRNENKPIEEKAAELGLEVVEVVSEQKKNGLDHVRKNINGYYTMDIDSDFDDTAIRKIYLHHTAVKKMYDFFKQSLESSEQTQETGCYFIGCWENAQGRDDVYDISVEDIVLPGDDIVPGEFSFSFGKKIGLSLSSAIDQMAGQSGRDYVHTVWMHSHPGLGLFLSAHDLLVQEQLHYPEAKGRMAAFVIDTNTPNWDFAVFTPKTAGGMNNKEELKRTYSLDSLYEWSRSANIDSGSQNCDSEQELREKYHSVQVNHQGSTKTLNVFFSGKVINMFEDMVYRAEGECKLAGYLIGNVDKKGNLIIEECSEEYSRNSLGVFITDGQSSYSEVVERYLVSNVWICAIVSRSDEEMWIITRPSGDAPCPAEDEIAVSSMRPMKEWLRRRRVYK